MPAVERYHDAFSCLWVEYGNRPVVVRDCDCVGGVSHDVFLKVVGQLAHIFRECLDLRNRVLV